MATPILANPVVADAVVNLENDNVDEHISNLEDLIHRKRMLEQNKKKFHLTEADCSLILTNANEFTFTDGQVILAEGQEIASLYRIKFGKVRATKMGIMVADLPTGWFIGETLLLGNKTSSALQITLTAVGPVVVSEVNVAFVQRLLQVDGILALKFYRNMASKLASIFFALNGNCLACFNSNGKQGQNLCSQYSGPISITDSPTLSPNDSTSSLHSVTTPLPIPPDFDGTRRFSVAAVEFFHSSKRKTKRLRMVNSAHLSYKVYPLESNGNVTRTCKIKKQRIKVVSATFGFKKKKTIEFSQIKTVSRSSPNAVTIIHGNLKARTFFFKDPLVLDEFIGLLNSIMAQSSTHNMRTAPSTPLSMPRRAGSDNSIQNTPDLSSRSSKRNSNGFFGFTLNESDNEDSDDEEEEPLSSASTTSLASSGDQGDRDLVRSLADRITLKKGDVLIAEGDLYQRLYSLTQGTCDVFADGKLVSGIPEGLVFGEASLLHLRPSPVTIVVSSEEAVILVIPAYRLFKVTESNPLLAARLHKKAAQLLEAKIAMMHAKFNSAMNNSSTPTGTPDLSTLREAVRVN